MNYSCRGIIIFKDKQELSEIMKIIFLNIQNNFIILMVKQKHYTCI